MWTPDALVEAHWTNALLLVIFHPGQIVGPTYPLCWHTAETLLVASGVLSGRGGAVPPGHQRPRRAHPRRIVRSVWELPHRDVFLGRDGKGTRHHACARLNPERVGIKKKAPIHLEVHSFRREAAKAIYIAHFEKGHSLVLLNIVHTEITAEIRSAETKYLPGFWIGPR